MYYKHTTTTIWSSRLVWDIQLQLLKHWSWLMLLNSDSNCSNKISFEYQFLHLQSSHGDRAVFKWLSKVITWLRLLRLVIGLKDSRQFFNQWDAKPKPIAPCTRDFSRASSELRVIARNCDWFMALFVPVVIGRSNCFGFGFSTVIWKPLYLLVWYQSFEFLNFFVSGGCGVLCAYYSWICGGCHQKRETRWYLVIHGRTDCIKLW